MVPWSVFIRDLLQALADAAVPYCVVGGVAVNLHGVPRMTYDVDLVVPTTYDALQRVDEVLVGLGLQCRLPIKLVDLADDALREQLREERNLIAVTYTDPRDPLREVDILVSPPIPATRLVARRHASDGCDPGAHHRDRRPDRDEASHRPRTGSRRRGAARTASGDTAVSSRGYTYTVSDEQLRTFASMSLSRRLQWLEELREFTYRLASPEIRERWRKLRQ
jgi:hypothetical protein